MRGFVRNFDLVFFFCFFVCFFLTVPYPSLFTDYVYNIPQTADTGDIFNLTVYLKKDRGRFYNLANSSCERPKNGTKKKVSNSCNLF